MTGHLLAYLVCAVMWGFVLYWTVVLISEHRDRRRNAQYKKRIDQMVERGARGVR